MLNKSAWSRLPFPTVRPVWIFDPAQDCNITSRPVLSRRPSIATTAATSDTPPSWIIQHTVLDIADARHHKRRGPLELYLMLEDPTPHITFVTCTGPSNRSTRSWKGYGPGYQKRNKRRPPTYLPVTGGACLVGVIHYCHPPTHRYMCSYHINARFRLPEHEHEYIPQDLAAQHPTFVHRRPR